MYIVVFFRKKVAFFLQKPIIFRIFAQNLVRDKSVISAR